MAPAGGGVEKVRLIIFVRQSVTLSNDRVCRHGVAIDEDKTTEKYVKTQSCGNVMLYTEAYDTG